MKYIYLFAAEAAKATARMPVIYMSAFIPIWFIVWMTDRWGPQLEHDAIESIIAVTMLCLLISLYQCASQTLTEEKSGSILSSYLCTPAHACHIMLGKTAGMAITALFAMVAVTVAGVMALLPLFDIELVVPMTGTDIVLMLIMLMAMAAADALILILCSATAKDRRFANLALILLPMALLGLVKIADNAVISALVPVAMPCLIKYTVSAIILLCCAVCWCFTFSKQLVSEAEFSLQ